jgi:pyruvate,water dikinase
MSLEIDRAIESPPLVLALEDIKDEHASLVGAKAAALAALKAKGLPVPNAFCLTTEAMRLFIREGALEARLAEIEAEATGGKLSLAESWAFLGETRKLICATEIPERLRAAIGTRYRELLGGAAAAVRSSGTKEDLGAASFAGQYETFLNVAGENRLFDAVRRCWASIWRNRVLQYAAKKGGGARDLAMGVLVQRLVRADVSGVLFTVNPLSGRDREFLVEACFGLGEALVSGKVNPDKFVVDARTGALLREEISEKRARLVPISRESAAEPGLGVREVEIPEADRRRAALAPAELAALVRLGGAVSEKLGAPADIEWALEKGEPWLLQARPITRLHFAPDFGEWTNANFKDGGVASDVCSPFMASLYDWIFTETMNQHWRALGLLPEDRKVQWFAVYFAKPYWSVGEVKRCLLSVPGFVERDFDEDLGLERPYEGRGRVAPLTIGAIFRGLRTLFRVRRLYRERLAAAKAFVPGFEKEYAAWDAIAPETLSQADLAERYERLIRDFYWRTESTYFLTVYSLSMAKIDFKAVFDKANRIAGGGLSYLHLITGLRDISHLRPYKELFELARKARRTGARPDLGPFLRKWQHHGTRELDITVARWGENRAFVEEMLDRYLAQPEDEDPAEFEERQARVYEEERKKAAAALSGRPLFRRKFFCGLDRMREFTWWREEVRDCSTRAYWLVRRFSLEVGRRAGIGEDIFFLPVEKALAAVRGEVDRDEIDWNRSYLARFRKFQNPNEIGAAHRMGERGAAGMAAPAAEPRKTLRGVPGSSGRRRARARIVRRLEEAKKVARGDAIVTVFTDPGWTPLLSIVSGIVTETGGLLSHAAVIAREYGIPAVLAAEGATLAIPDGAEIVIDGDAGVIEIG